MTADQLCLRAISTHLSFNKEVDPAHIRGFRHWIYLLQSNSCNHDTALAPGGNNVNVRTQAIQNVGFSPDQCACRTWHSDTTIPGA